MGSIRLPPVGKQSPPGRSIYDNDATILPHLRILNSGSALHALSRHRPILAPAIGALPELRADTGQEWVSLYDGDISAEVIDAFLQDGPSADMPLPNMSKFAWPAIGGRISDYLEKGKSA